MKTRKTHLTGFALASACLTLGLSAQAQTIEGQDTAPEPQERPPIEIGPSAQDEMSELFRAVEMRLQQIDELLTDAGAGDLSALDEVGESGIDDLLNNSMDNSRQVIEDIDRILEIAAQNGGT